MIINSVFAINTLTANAETANFYEAEYIEEIYLNKYQYSTKTIYYQKARFFRKAGTNEFAYCLEPFIFFNPNSEYTSTVTPRNLSENQKDQISKIAYFGYGYKNHTEPKWYAITQYLIWQTADPTSGDYYFTDSLNGNRINPYQNEINEIYNLINNYNMIPSFSNQTFTTIENKSLILRDQNQVLNNFTVSSKDLTVENNQIKIENLKEGKYKFKLTSNESFYKKPLIFYQSNNSQNLLKTGDLTPKEASLNINVLQTSLTLTKIDKDTQSIIPSTPDACLDDANYVLYDSNMKKLAELTIKDNEAYIKNLEFGKYYLKEKTAGTGYTIDDTIYEIIIDEQNPKKELILENSIIKKKITIKKEYGENNSFQSEKNIDFEIYNQRNELIKTISTNEEGIAEVTLPYGKYTIIQKNSTSGYNKVSPFKISVTDTKDELIHLKDYKIPVPDTHTENGWLKTLIACLLLLILC